MMTEQKTETANYGGLVWQKARLVLRMASSVADWPNAFTPTELAKLQYPESAGTEKRKMRDNRRALEAALEAAIQAGRIVTTLKSKSPTSHISLAEWGRGSMQSELEPSEVTAIERSPFRAWLSANKQESSEHIHAWLGDQVQPAQSPESASSQAEAPAKSRAEIAKRHAELSKTTKAATLQTAKEFDVSDSYVRQCVREEKAKPRSGMAAMAKQLTPSKKKRTGV